MEPMNLPPGFLLPEGKTMADVLRMDAELLAGEGLGPNLPAFDEDAEGSDADPRSD